MVGSVPNIREVGEGFGGRAGGGERKEGVCSSSVDTELCCDDGSRLARGRVACLLLMLSVLGVLLLQSPWWYACPDNWSTEFSHSLDFFPLPCVSSSEESALGSVAGSRIS